MLILTNPDLVLISLEQCFDSFLLLFLFFPPQPELTVENLPSFLSLGKALLLLFVGEEDDEFGWRQSQALVEELRAVKTDRYLTCWIHLCVFYSFIQLKLDPNINA